MLWRRLRGRYTERMEDREKIQNKLDELNKGLKKPIWDESLGFVMMPAIDIKNNSITLDSGIAVKLFINTETGEVQTFWADNYMDKSSDGSKG